MSIDILINGVLIVTMNQDRQVIDKGAIAIAGDTIVQVFPSEQNPKDHSAKRVIQADGMVAIPGLINAHSHLAMTLFRGFVEDLELRRWLEKVWKYELSALNENSVRVGAKLAIAESIRSGVTCAHDMYWYYETTMALAEEVGFRLISGPPMHDIGGQDLNSMVTQARSVLDSVNEYKYVHPIVQAHSVYTTSPEMMNVVRDMKEEYEVAFTIHASENKSEVEDVTSKFGLTPIELLQSYKLLDDKSILAHCVQLEDEDIEILSQNGCHVVHCPESNLKLGGGIARIADMLDAGVNVCLGTDGAASNNDLDMLGEMRTAALLQKGIRSDPRVLTTVAVMEMATINGAKAYGFDHLVGSIEPGKKADVALIDFRKAHLTPCHDVYANLVYSASKADVDTVIIDGRIHMEGGRLSAIEEDTLLAEVNSISGDFV
ncbi:MAG: amidohydrolase family protein [Anaerolineales bacterium]|nr:amidohydrolase family protein [Anaerolineales bacterium]